MLHERTRHASARPPCTTTPPAAPSLKSCRVEMLAAATVRCAACKPSRISRPPSTPMPRMLPGRSRLVRPCGPAVTTPRRFAGSNAHPTAPPTQGTTIVRSPSPGSPPSFGHRLSHPLRPLRLQHQHLRSSRLRRRSSLLQRRRRSRLRRFIDPRRPHPPRPLEPLRPLACVPRLLLLRLVQHKRELPRRPRFAPPRLRRLRCAPRRHRRRPSERPRARCPPQAPR